MSRSLWFAAGAGAGVYAMVRARRLAEAVTVDGLRDRANGALAGLRALREEVAVGQAERDTELRERFRLVPHGGELEGSGGSLRDGRSATSSAQVETVAARPPRPAAGRDTEGRT